MIRVKILHLSELFEKDVGNMSNALAVEYDSTMHEAKQRGIVMEKKRNLAKTVINNFTFY